MYDYNSQSESQLQDIEMRFERLIRILAPLVLLLYIPGGVRPMTDLLAKRHLIGEVSFWLQFTSSIVLTIVSVLAAGLIWWYASGLILKVGQDGINRNLYGHMQFVRWSDVTQYKMKAIYPISLLLGRALLLKDQQGTTLMTVFPAHMENGKTLIQFVKSKMP